MNILLAAVMYSPNIGDGVIADCFCAAAPNDVQISKLDLAGRLDYGGADGESNARHRVLAALSVLPANLSDAIARQLVSAQIRHRLKPLLPNALANKNGVLIGGGQLLADANLNFPLKIHSLVGAAAARDVPFGIHSVGVSATWSSSAARLFGDVLGHPKLRFLSVRDTQSRDNLMRHLSHLGLGHIDPPQVFPDPGFLAATLTEPTKTPVFPLHVGLGITHPTAISLHGGERPAQDWPVWYAECARAIVERGFRVTLFTNGAIEDEDCLARTAALLYDLAGPQITYAPRPRKPTDLVHLISEFGAVIAHRLHASIVAYSSGAIPIGLPWDRKLEGFFKLIERPENLMQTAQPVPRVLAQMVSAASIDRERQANLRKSARDGVRAAVAAFP